MAKKVMEDSLTQRLPAIDTLNIDRKGKLIVKQTIQDSLGVKLPPADTAKLKEEIKTTIKQAAKDSLNNYVDVPDITIDSTTTKQVKSKARARLEDEIGHKVPQDSASVKNEAKQLAKDQLKEQTGIDAPDIAIDSTTVDQLKQEAESRAEKAVKNTDELKGLEGEIVNCQS